MPVRLSFDFIKSEFERVGYKLLSNTYMNAHQKLDYICPKGHNHNITLNNWRKGQRCAYCAGNGKLTIEFIKFEFERENYILLLDYTGY